MRPFPELRSQVTEFPDVGAGNQTTVIQPCNQLPPPLTDEDAGLHGLASSSQAQPPRNSVSHSVVQPS